MAIPDNTVRIGHSPTHFARSVVVAESLLFQACREDSAGFHADRLHVDSLQPKAPRSRQDAPRSRQDARDAEGGKDVAEHTEYEYEHEDDYRMDARDSPESSLSKVATNARMLAVIIGQSWVEYYYGGIGATAVRGKDAMVSCLL
eukprot:scaffold21309_cov46-Prasinocladus_malaysianus.AAC.3